MGSVFQRGQIWWVKYHRNGRPFRESSRSEKKSDAIRLLKRREGSIAEGTFKGLQPEKTRLRQLLDDLLNDYRIKSRKSIGNVQVYSKRLLDYFGESRAISITTDRIRSYIKERLEQRASNALVNRELAALKRAYFLGKQCGKVVTVPHIPRLNEDNVRKGFFSDWDYQGLREALPNHLKGVVALGYFTGMRRGEILGLKWGQVDFHERMIRLEPGTTKNGEGRNIPMTDHVFEDLKVQLQRWQSRRRKQGASMCDHVFFNPKRGTPLNDFRWSWDKACKAVGKEGALFHDLRRSAVRNLVRAGVPEKVAMSISGHKTRSVFDRYNIVNNDDRHDAILAVQRRFEDTTSQHSEVARLDARRAGSSKESRAHSGHNLGTIDDFRGKDDSGPLAASY